MDIISKITDIVEPSLVSMGYAIVVIRLSDGKRRKILTIMAERADGQAMSFDDCTEISHTASTLLEVDDPIVGAYDLEVCSPGIDRPLTKGADYTRYAGAEAKMETILPIDGRKRFRGVIKGLDKESVMLNMPEGDVVIPLSHVRSAKLVVSEAVVAENLKKQKKKK